MKHPIDSIRWIPVERLEANDYNPNVVYNQELKLLELSLLKQGWIQPVLACKEDDKYVIIDGYHRWWLTKNKQQCREMTDGMVPCAVLELSIPERMLLTVRINRAKGSHIACKMHELISSVVNEYQYSIADVCSAIGATKDEVDLLLKENVFKKLDIENHEYSKAWYPRK